MSDYSGHARNISLATAFWLAAVIGLASVSAFLFVRSGDLATRLAAKETEVRGLNEKLQKGVESVADAVQHARAKDQAQIQDLAEKLQKAESDMTVAVGKAHADEKASCEQNLTARVKVERESLQAAEERAKTAAGFAAQEKEKWEALQTDHQQWIQDIKQLRQEKLEFTSQQDQLKLVANRMNEREISRNDYAMRTRKNESESGVMLNAVYMAYMGANHWKNDKDKFCAALRAVTQLGSYQSANDIDAIEPFRRQFIDEMRLQLGEKQAASCTATP